MGPARARWWVIAGFWIAQAALTIWGWPLLFLYVVPGWPEYPFLIAVVVSIMMFQAAMVLPAAPIEARVSSPRRRLARCLIAGLAAGTLLSWTVTTVLLMIGVPPALEGMFSRNTPGWLHALVPWLGAPLLAAPITLALWRSSRHGMPVLVSLSIAGFVASLLIVGMVAGALSGADLLGIELRVDMIGFLVFLMIPGWVIATPLVAVFTRKWRGSERIYRLSSLLFRGTVIGAAAMIPLDVMVRRKTDCYCNEGTFWALTWCWAAGLVALGPVVYLLPARRQQRRRMRGMCEFCGYDMSGTPDAARCPECGAEWHCRRGFTDPGESRAL